MPKYAKLNAVRFGVACGIISAIIVALTTLAGIFGAVPTWTQLLTECYGIFGYSVSFIGLILGAFYAFIDGFIVAGVLILLYNRMI